MTLATIRHRPLTRTGCTHGRAILLLSIGLSSIAEAQRTPPPASPSRGALSADDYAIVGVHVIPMTADTVIRDATVVVRRGRITSVTTGARSGAPAGLRRIDGQGRYLVPGFADMHTHLHSDGSVPDSAGPAELGVMLANGITAARLMIGTPEHLTLRRDVQAGRVIGPQLWVASPHVTTTPSENASVVRSPDDVRRVVREAKARGFDFVKVTFGIDGALYDALVDEAARQRIRVVGHVEPSLGIARALRSGQQLEHLDAYFEESLADDAPFRAALTQYGAYEPRNWRALDYVDTTKVERLARETVRAGTWLVPTLDLFNRWFSIPLADSALFALPDWQMIPRTQRGPYLEARARYWSRPVTRAQRARYAAFRNDVVRRVARAGGAAQLMAGSDAPDLLMAYGFAYHRELAHLVDAGLTPYQALAAATINPATFLGAHREWGTIAPGRRADLLLLAANPLNDIRNTMRIDAVVMGGRWLERPQLDSMIARGRAAIDGEAPSRASLDTLLHNADRKAALGVVADLFAAMQQRDTAAMRTLFAPGARLVGMRAATATLGYRMQSLSPEQFARALIADTTRGSWIERLWEPTVLLEGTLATVWGRYDFHFDKRFSHCGVDSVHLLKTTEGWRITEIADTYQTVGCPSRPVPGG